jgi:hypothetical protein
MGFLKSFFDSKTVGEDPINKRAKKNFKNYNRNLQKKSRGLNLLVPINLIFLLLSFLVYMNYHNNNIQRPTGEIINVSEKQTEVSNNDASALDVNNKDQTNINNDNTIPLNTNPTDTAMEESTTIKEIKYNNITIKANRIKMLRYIYNIHISAYKLNDKYWEVSTNSEHFGELYIDDINLDGIPELIYKGSAGMHYTYFSVYKIIDGEIIEIFNASGGDGVFLIDIDGDGVKEIKVGIRLYYHINDEMMTEYSIYKWNGQSYAVYYKYTDKTFK